MKLKLHWQILIALLLAVQVGLLIVNMVAPGMVNGAPARHLAGQSENAADVVAAAAKSP